MKPIGLIYGTSTNKTALIAEEVKKAFGDTPIEVMSLEEFNRSQLDAYDFLIIGCSTWFDGELPPQWDELVPALRSLNLTGKKVAIFGLGDQVNYPENFADGIGILAYIFTGCGATIVGQTSTEGYTFEHSLALKSGKFQGLVIDMENQSDKNEERIRNWVEELKKIING